MADGGFEACLAAVVDEGGDTLEMDGVAAVVVV